MMETKEQKPWYHGHTPTVGSQNDALYVILGRGEASFWICRMMEGDNETQMRWANLFAAAPKTATQRDSLLSVQKQLVEALREAKSVVDAACMSDDLDGTPSDDQAVLVEIRAKIDAAILAAKASS